MQRADEIPGMITIHSSGGLERSEKEERRKREGGKVKGEGVGEEGWGEKERGCKLSILVGDNDMITQLFCLCPSEVT